MNSAIFYARSCLVIVALLLIYNMSSAQNMGSMHMSMPMNHSKSHESKNIYLGMMDSMMVQMDKAASTTSAETDFVSQMIPHHEGAVAMAKYEIQHGENSEMIQLAKSILEEQQSELQQMRIWLTKHHVTEPSLPKGFKQEMDKTMSTMMENMPDPDKLNDTDHAFALIMIPHHQAAIDMAKVVLKYANEQQTISFAIQLISNEQVEVEQMIAYSK